MTRYVMNRVVLEYGCVCWLLAAECYAKSGCSIFLIVLIIRLLRLDSAAFKKQRDDGFVTVASRVLQRTLVPHVYVSAPVQEQPRRLQVAISCGITQRSISENMQVRPTVEKQRSDVCVTSP